MPNPKTFHFHAYFDAHLAAHQFAEEGHRAEVYDSPLGTAPWPGTGFTVAVHKDGLGKGEPMADGSEPRFGDFESGALVHGIDSFLRHFTLAGIFGVPFYWFYLFITAKPKPFDPYYVSIAIAISLALLAVGLIGSVVAYQSFRAERPFGTVLFMGVAWCFAASYIVSCLLGILFILTYILGIGIPFWLYGLLYFTSGLAY